MAELVLHGLVGGHSGSRGWYPVVVPTVLEALLDPLEAQVGSAPLLRIRFDIDGDGIYEVTELSNVLDSGSINRSIEYAISKSTFGSASFSLKNVDLRWSDNNENAYTYFDPAAPTRYHYRPVIIELGFDTLNKKDENSWMPIFKGYIQSKEEMADRTVQFQLIDEWTLFFSRPIVKTQRADALFDYTYDEEDAREIQMGMYYGDALMLNRENKNQENLMIPCAYNLHYVRVPHSIIDWSAYCVYSPQMQNSLENNYDYENAELWFWSWFRQEEGVWTHEPQWVRLPRHYTVGGTEYDNWNFGLDQNDKQSVWLWGGLAGVRDFYAADGTLIQINLTNYFVLDDEDFDARISLSVHCLENKDNAAYIVYDLLTGYSSGENRLAGKLDVSSTNPALWQDLDVDFQDSNYYSFDVSYTYLKDSEQHVALNTNSGDAKMSDVIDNLCSLSRAGFFIDRGKSANGDVTRQIRFVIHQPRRVPPELLKLRSNKIKDIIKLKDVLEIKNLISVTNFPYDLSYDLMSDVEVHQATNEDSITVYNEQRLDIANKPGDVVFLYDSSAYAQFVAEHYLMLYREPPTRVDIDTSLIALNWDLKSLLAVQEDNMILDYEQGVDDTGIFEVYGFNFNGTSFDMTLQLRWAGYLFNPEGDINKTWGWWGDFTWDDESYYW